MDLFAPTVAPQSMSQARRYSAMDIDRNKPYRAVVVFVGIEDASAEEVLRQGLALSKLNYTDFHVEPYDDATGAIARFDYTHDQQEVMECFYRLQDELRTSASNNAGATWKLQIGIEIPKHDYKI